MFNHTEDAYNLKLKEATDNAGFDVILENLANVNLNVDLQMIKRSKSTRLKSQSIFKQWNLFKFSLSDVHLN